MGDVPRKKGYYHTEITNLIFILKRYHELFQEGDKKLDFHLIRENDKRGKRFSHKDTETEEEDCNDDQKSTVKTGHHPLLPMKIQIKNTNMYKYKS